MTDADDDAERWREVFKLRREFSHWVIIWLSPAREFRAYGRRPGARRDTVLTATTAVDLAVLIDHAEPGPPRPVTR